MLLMLSLTPLFGQTGDSLTCYTNEELLNIATKIVYANECEELLTIADSQLVNQQQQIQRLNEILISQNELIGVKDSLVADWKAIADKTQKELDVTKKKLWWTKLGLGTSTVLLVVSLLLNAL